MIIAIQLLVLRCLEDQTTPCHFLVHIYIHLTPKLKKFVLGTFSCLAWAHYVLWDDEIFSKYIFFLRPCFKKKMLTFKEIFSSFTSFELCINRFLNEGIDH